MRSIMPTDASPTDTPRMAGLAAICLIALASGACGKNPPTTPLAPSPPATTTALPTAPVQFAHIFGVVVDDRHAPVSSANLTFYGLNGPVTITGDAGGAFDVHVAPYAVGLDVVLEKPGYERTAHFIAAGVGAEVQHNLVLPAILKVPAGNSIRLSLNPDDPSCGFDDQFLCRTVRVSSPSNGTLKLEVVADRADARLGISLASEAFPSLGATRLSREVTAGSETAVNVLMWWTASQPESFTLMTSLAPN
jgi:hypothetical protein